MRWLRRNCGCPRTRSPRWRSPTCPTPSSVTSSERCPGRPVGSRREWGEAAQIGGGMQVALTVADFLNRAALVYGHRPAVVDEPSVPGSFGTLTYGELEARARGMALAVDELGVEHGERVAIVSPNSGRFLTSYFGVSGYGRVLVPINFRLTA